MTLIETRPQPGLAERLVDESFAVAGPDLTVGGMSLAALAARYATPLYVYDAGLMRRAFRRLTDALAGFASIYYSVKANPNPAVARVFVEEGAGLEIASGAEYARARAAGAAPEHIVFAGPGKTQDELAYVVRHGIGEIHVESYEEIALLDEIGAQARRAVRVAPRVNPVPAAQGGALRMGGRPSPFGFDEEELDAVVDAIVGRTHLELTGVHLFAGTQILDAATLLAQWHHALALAARVGRRLGRPLRTVDLGGGLGIPYFAGDGALDLDAVRRGVPDLARTMRADRHLSAARVILEPGRYLVGPAGLYVARVVSVKQSRGKRFVVTDGGMHHHLAASGNLGQLIKHDFPIVAATRMNASARAPAVVTGPLCTPLDTLARKAALPELAPGDLIAVLQSGAYGLTASPVGFLSHPMPAEVLMEDGRATPIRPRGTFEVPITPLP